MQPKSPKSPSWFVQSNLIQGNLTSQMGEMELQEEKGEVAAGWWSTPLRRVGSSLSFYSHCRVRPLEVDAPGEWDG